MKRFRLPNTCIQFVSSNSHSIGGNKLNVLHYCCENWKKQTENVAI